MENEQVITDNELQVLDESSVLYNILGFLIPVVGFTIYFNIQEETPIKAKSLGMAALAGLWIGAVISGLSILASL